MIAYDIVDSSFNLKLSNGLKSFLILWRNNVFTRLYKKHLDTFSLIETNGQLFNFNNIIIDNNNDIVNYLNDEVIYKLNNLKTISTMLIQSYESTGFYSDSDKFINFISDNFTIDKQIKEISR